MGPSESRRLELAAALRPRLLAIARRHTTPADAEDAVQIATLRVIDAPVDDPHALEAWLATTTVRACSELRRGATPTLRAAVRLTAAAYEDDHAEAACARAEAQWLAMRIAQLPKPLRRTAELLSTGGTYHDVARELAVTERAARHYIERTKARLRQEVTDARSALLAIWHRRAPVAPRLLSAVPTPLWDTLTVVIVISGIAGMLAKLPALRTPQPVHHAAAHAALPGLDAVDVADTARQAWVRQMARLTAEAAASAISPPTPPGVGQQYAGEQNRALPPALSQPLGRQLDRTKRGKPGGKGEREPYRTSPPLHVWVLWCAKNIEVSPRNVGCPKEGEPNRR